MGLFLSFAGFSLLSYTTNLWESAMREKVNILLKRKIDAFQNEQQNSIPIEVYEDESELQKQMQAERAVFSQKEQAYNEKISHLNQVIKEHENALSKAQVSMQELESKSETYIENEQKRLIKDCEAKLLQIKESSEANLSKKETALSESRQTVTEQKKILEQKHKQIQELEKKVRDLNYEVKTLLQLGAFEAESQSYEEEELNISHPLIDVFEATETSLENVGYEPQKASCDKELHTPYDAAVQLQKCIEKAQKLKGIHDLGKKDSRFSDLSLNHYALDLRRLFDSFRNENSCMVLIYSPKEKRLLFSNNHSKNILGWSPEKLIKDFHSLIKKGRAEWSEALDRLKTCKESQARLLLQGRSGQDVLLHCHLGLIPSGLFSQHVIAVLFPM